jgi:hypothetical protein
VGWAARVGSCTWLAPAAIMSGINMPALSVPYLAYSYGVASFGEGSGTWVVGLGIPKTLTLPELG